MENVARWFRRLACLMNGFLRRATTLPCRCRRRRRCVVDIDFLSARELRRRASLYNETTLLNVAAPDAMRRDRTDRRWLARSSARPSK